MFDLLHPAARMSALALLMALSSGTVAQAQTPSWIIPGELAAAKAEGARGTLGGACPRGRQS